MNSLKPPNQTTQPISSFPVFNNWDVIANGWYFVATASELQTSQVKGFQICGQEIVVYRDDDNELHALDAYCPHMGTHLGVGKVQGKNLRCFFHHWQFNGQGECIKIPCQNQVPKKIKTMSYKVVEKYGAIWIFPAEEAEFSLTSFQEIQDDRVEFEFGKAYERRCHHHVTMINGIDPQHLKTVHSIDIEMDVQLAERESGDLIDIVLTGKIGNKNFKERLVKKIFGEKYSYSMRYDSANNGFLTLLKNAQLFGDGPALPALHMIFAYRPLDRGKTLVQPIYITRKRKGFVGFLANKVLIFLTKKAFFSLQSEDGLIYENMRFFPANLLEIDRPISIFIQYVNKLKISRWSGAWK
jgi:phenylpropionate dioxygenase-like ring-hydroxylating dioxygenase large terminal subunit